MFLWAVLDWEWYQWFVLPSSLIFWQSLFSSSYRRHNPKFNYIISLLHAGLGFVLGAYVLLFHLWPFQWWDVPDSYSQAGIALCLFSLAYFICDLADAVIVVKTIDVFTAHHLLVILGYCTAIFSGYPMKGLMYHLFYSEMGNVITHSRTVGVFGGSKSPALYDSFALLTNRIAWLIHCWPSMVHQPFEYTFRTWVVGDYMACLGSIALLGGDALFAVLLLIKVIKQLQISSTSSPSSIIIKEPINTLKKIIIQPGDEIDDNIDDNIDAILQQQQQKRKDSFPTLITHIRNTKKSLADVKTGTYKSKRQ